MHAVILADTGFQDEEFVYPYYRMLEEGWRVDVCTAEGKDRFGKYGVPARANSTFAFEELPDLVVIPGGFECPDRLRLREDVRRLVRRMNEAGKLIAAICHGPWVLISAGVVQGRKVVGYDSIWEDLRNAGADVPHADVVEDGNLITARHYRNNPAFMKAVVRNANRTSWGLELCGAAAR